MHQYPRWSGSPWLLAIAVCIDEWLKEKPSRMRRFHEMLRRWNDETQGEEGLEFPTGQVRALHLWEQYAVLAAIHDRICTRVRVIDPWKAARPNPRWRAQTEPEMDARIARLWLGAPYAVLKNAVDDLLDSKNAVDDRFDLHCRHLQTALRKVAADLGAKLRPMAPPPPRPGPVSVSVDRPTQLVVHAAAALPEEFRDPARYAVEAIPVESLAPQKKGPKKKRRKRAKLARRKSTTPTREMVKAHELYGTGLSLREVRAALANEYGEKRIPSSPTTIKKWIVMAESFLKPKAKSARAHQKLPTDRRGQSVVSDD